MIKAVVFDCFGVLYGGSLQSFLNMCPNDKINDLKDLSKRSDYGYMTRLEYRRELAELLDVDEDEIEGILSQKHIRNDELVDYLKNLKKDYKIGLLSNVGEETIQRLFTDEERNQLFDQVILSYEEGMTKPHPLIFGLMARRLELHPEECIMVDDLQENCQGAITAGMFAVQHITNEYTQKEIERITKEQVNA